MDLSVVSACHSAGPASRGPIAIIGAPTDVGAGVPGARLAPDALRLAKIAQRLSQCGRDVLDLGNLAGPPNPEQDPHNGYRHLREVVAWNSVVHSTVLNVLAQGQLPVLLGGDHSLAVGSISAVARHCKAVGKELRVLWLDAHADFNTAQTTPSGNLHGMPVACLCGHGPTQLLELGVHVPAISPGAIHQVGIRSVDPGERNLLHLAKVNVADMRLIDERGMREAMTRALDGVGDDVHLHVSFDIDYLDPEIAPGVGTTVPGGPSLREAQLCMEMIADTGALASVDVVELNPALDERNRSAEIAVTLLESMFGKRTLHRD